MGSDWSGDHKFWWSWLHPIEDAHFFPSPWISKLICIGLFWKISYYYLPTENVSQLLIFLLILRLYANNLKIKHCYKFTLKVQLHSHIQNPMSNIGIAQWNVHIVLLRHCCGGEESVVRNNLHGSLKLLLGVARNLPET